MDRVYLADILGGAGGKAVGAGAFQAVVSMDEGGAPTLSPSNVGRQCVEVALRHCNAAVLARPVVNILEDVAVKRLVALRRERHRCVEAPQDAARWQDVRSGAAPASVRVEPATQT